MKTILLVCGLALLPALTPAQNTGSYTNGINTIPPNNGSLTPGQNNNYTLTLPNTYPSSTGTNPINPANTSPTGSNSTFPSSPGSPQLNQLQHLFQDPVRTPANVKRSDPVQTMDGSSGKHRRQHKFTPAKKNGFVTNRRTRGVKAKTRVSREKSSD